MPTETIISMAVAVCALIFTALSFRRTQNQDTSATAAERATMAANIQYIRTSIDDIKLEYKSIQKDISELSKKVVEIDASARQAHKRIDEITQKKG